MKESKLIQKFKNKDQTVDIADQAQLSQLLVNKVDKMKEWVAANALTPVDNNQDTLKEIKQAVQDNGNKNQIDLLQAQLDQLTQNYTLSKRLFELQSEGNKKQDLIVDAFKDLGQIGGSVNINTVNSPTSFSQSPTTSSSFRQSIMQR